jgi:predicted nucleic-acid-binding protein
VIALDTNVLIRYLTRDNPEQAEAARALLQGLTTDNPGFICREVVIEVVWVLERSYRFSRERIANIVVELVATDTLVIEDDNDVAQADAAYREGSADFSDLMILSAANRVGAQPLYTFDRQFARLDGTELVEV